MFPSKIKYAPYFLTVTEEYLDLNIRQIDPH